MIIFSYCSWVKKAFQVNEPPWDTHQVTECGFMFFARLNLTHTINHCEN